jgi:transposase
VQEFYSTLPGPVRVDRSDRNNAVVSELMEALGIDCQVGHPAKIRAAEPQKQKHDRRDAELILRLLAENRFPSTYQPLR